MNATLPLVRQLVKKKKKTSTVQHNPM